MAILKNKTQGNYTIVSNGILKNRSLSLKDRGLIITLLSLPDNWAFTINGLSKIIPDGKDSIKNSLKHLEELGYVSKTQSRGEFGKYGNIVIEVHETPILPIVENPLTENPLTGNVTSAIYTPSCTKRASLFLLLTEVMRSPVRIWFQ